MYFDPKMCGKRIQVLRKKKGLTQLQLSFKINVSESHLRAVETGTRGASIDLLIECAEPKRNCGQRQSILILHLMLPSICALGKGF